MTTPTVICRLIDHRIQQVLTDLLSNAAIPQKIHKVHSGKTMSRLPPVIKKCRSSQLQITPSQHSQPMRLPTWIFPYRHTLLAHLEGAITPSTRPTKIGKSWEGRVDESRHRSRGRNSQAASSPRTRLSIRAAPMYRRITIQR